MKREKGCSNKNCQVFQRLMADIVASEEINDQEKVAEAGRKEICGAKQVNEKLAAEEQRQRPMESLGKTQNRKADEGNAEVKVNKSR